MLKSRYKIGSIILLATLIVASTARADPPAGAIGPEYFVDITLKNGGIQVGTAKIKWDPGAGGTPISRADATSWGLLDANGDPVPNLFSGEKLGGKNANQQKSGPYAISIGLDVSVVGKDKNGKDLGKTVVTPEKKNVAYPEKGVTDIKSLLGTNIIKELPKEEKRTPEGDISYGDVPPPPDPKNTIPLHSFFVNFYDFDTGLPEDNPLIANTLMGIVGSTVSSQSETETADFVYVGSAYTIISQSLANALGAQAVGNFDMFDQDPETFSDLNLEGFLGTSIHDPFDIVELESLSLPTDSGEPLKFPNVFALVNPFPSVTANLFGTNVFAASNLTVFDDFIDGKVQVFPVPEPKTWVLIILGFGGLGAARSARRIAGAFLHL